jgi:hypothetical protein
MKDEDDRVKPRFVAEKLERAPRRRGKFARSEIKTRTPLEGERGQSKAETRGGV